MLNCLKTVLLTAIFCGGGSSIGLTAHAEYAIRPAFLTMTEAEIETGLLQVQVTRNRYESPRQAPKDLFLTGLAAAQALPRLQGKKAEELILLGLTSYSDAIRQVAAQAIGSQSPETILAFVDYILNENPNRLLVQPPRGINTKEETIQLVAAKLLKNNMHVKGAEAVFDRALSSTKSSFILRKIAKAAEACSVPACLEIIKRHWLKIDPFTAGLLLKGLANLEDSKQLFELIDEAQRSNSHVKREGAIYAAVGRQNMSYLPMIFSATTALYHRTRMHAFSGLRTFNDPRIWSYYQSGLSDSSKDVRYFVMSKLARRSEPQARELLSLVANGTGLNFRTEAQQWRLARLSERIAEKFSYLRDSAEPDLSRLQLDVASWERQRIYEVWENSGLSDADIARRLLGEMGAAFQTLPSRRKLLALPDSAGSARKCQAMFGN